MPDWDKWYPSYPAANAVVACSKRFTSPCSKSYQRFIGYAIYWFDRSKLLCSITLSKDRGDCCIQILRKTYPGQALNPGKKLVNP